MLIGINTGINPCNAEDLKKAFELIKLQDTKDAKKKHYSRAYYLKNKLKYKIYYQDNQQRIKEYAKQYKIENKNNKKTSEFSIVNKQVVLYFDSKKTEDLTEVDNKQFFQLFFQKNHSL